jgi:hypothetical protein
MWESSSRPRAHPAFRLMERRAMRSSSVPDREGPAAILISTTAIRHGGPVGLGIAGQRIVVIAYLLQRRAGRAVPGEQEAPGQRQTHIREARVGRQHGPVHHRHRGVGRIRQGRERRRRSGCRRGLAPSWTGHPNQRWRSNVACRGGGDRGHDRQPFIGTLTCAGHPSAPRPPMPGAGRLSRGAPAGRRGATGESLRTASPESTSATDLSSSALLQPFEAIPPDCSR